MIPGLDGGLGDEFWGKMIVEVAGLHCMVHTLNLFPTAQPFPDSLTVLVQPSRFQILETSGTVLAIVVDGNFSGTPARIHSKTVETSIFLCCHN